MWGDPIKSLVVRGQRYQLPELEPGRSRTVVVTAVDDPQIIGNDAERRVYFRNMEGGGSDDLPAESFARQATMLHESALG